ncbi:MAG: hypothetical protein COB25_003920, partial [Oceanospirillales bacterium]|nr:hypothetical protein [Oceanospirillales bacterium]
MTNRKKTPLTPNAEIVVLKSSGRHIIKPGNTLPSVIGEKAYGLACLPQNWTPNWFLISSDFFKDYATTKTEENKNKMLEYWSSRCLNEIDSSELSKNKEIIIRFSGTNETLKDRGKFYSKTGKLDNFKETLKLCLDENLKDPDSEGQDINFVVQSYVRPREKGHLSNERRCSKEQRDWLGEIEKTLYSEPFKVNYRPWRTKIEIETAISDEIKCNLSINIQKSLISVAAWAQNIENRLHFEWVWDGKSIFLVQVEKETAKGTFDPTISVKNKTSDRKNDFKIFREIDTNDAQKYRKIKNVFVYKKLKLPIVPIYILDDQKTIESLSKGVVSKDLASDIEILTKSSLIIRTDIASNDQKILQMLPRSEELRSKDVAIHWLIQQSCAILKNIETRNQKIAFICHNFIPSESAAFAFATPGERKVQIEALWGIPEGLYYNSHDKYVVDTLNRKTENTSTLRSSYKIHKKVQFKNYCVAPDDKGEWKMQEISPPYDWRSSIRKEEWLTYIAANSRRIAEHEQKATSVMWFVGLVPEDGQPELIPWFHEECHAVSPQKSNDFQKKTPNDKIFEIKYEKDINKLKAQLESGKSSITHIRVKPVEEHLLREKATLRRIGEIAKSANKVILLEGATLSHAYYQLVEVGAL